MKIVVVYDIPVEHNKLRTEVREFLRDMGGTFIQYSVYETDLDERGLERLVRGLEAILEKGSGKIDIFLPCNQCYRGRKIIDTYEP